VTVQAASADLRVGVRVPALTLTPALEDLVRWAGAANDFTTFHFDPEAARSRGFDGPVVHGTFQATQLARLLTEWLGPQARLRELSCRYRRPVIVGTPMVCGAEVKAVEPDGAGSVVTFDVWTESPPGEVTTTGTATVHIPSRAGASASLITDELLEVFHVGEVAGRYTFEITPEQIWKLTCLLHDTDLETAVVHREGGHEPLRTPTTIFALLDPLELKIMSHDRGIDLVPYRKTGGGNAFNEVEYERPVRGHDVVTVEVTFTEIYERRGQGGPLLFRVRKNVLTDQHGGRIGVSRSGHVYSFEVPGYEPPPRSQPKPAAADLGEDLPPLIRVPTTQTLVRYAAAADDFAPLHFDHGYARSRGYDGVIVHGFLKAGYMATLVEDWAGPGAFVNRFRVEYRGPDYPDAPITCRGRVTRRFEEGGRRGADLVLWTERADGSVTTRGSATVRFFAQ
jgi:acyl dehydratase